MGKCKNCKFWNKSIQWINDDIYAGCDAILDKDMSTERNAIAYIADCLEGVTHSVHTKGDFGCKLFQESL